MYSSRLFMPPSSARQATPPPNPGESREQRDQICWSCWPEIWQATRGACPIWERLEKIPAKSHGRTTVRPAKEGPDVLCLEVSAKPSADTSNEMKWRQKYHATSAILQNFIIWFHITVGVSQRTTTEPETARLLLHRTDTGPITGRPRRVHRVYILVYVYYTTITIYKYEIMREKKGWGSDSPSGTTACNKYATPHTRSSEKILPRWIVSATRPTAASHRAIWAATMATSSYTNVVVQVTENVHS